MRFSIRLSLFALLSLFLITPAGAAEFGLFGWDLRAGAVIEDGPDAATVGFSLNVAELIPGLYLYPGASYTTGDSGRSLRGEDVDADTLSLGIEVRYFLAQERRGWYFGGGPYYHRSDTGAFEVNLGGEIFVVRDRTEDDFGPVGVAGYQFGDTGRGWLVEARVAAAAGPFDGLQLLGGYSF